MDKECSEQKVYFAKVVWSAHIRKSLQYLMDDFFSFLNFKNEAASYSIVGAQNSSGAC